MPCHDVVLPVQQAHAALLGRAMQKAGGKATPLCPVGGPIVHKASSSPVQQVCHLGRHGGKLGVEQERTYCIAGCSKSPAKGREGQLGQLVAFGQGGGEEGFPVGTRGVGGDGWLLRLALEILLLGSMEVMKLAHLAAMEG